MTRKLTDAEKWEALRRWAKGRADDVGALVDKFASKSVKLNLVSRYTTFLDVVDEMSRLDAAESAEKGSGE